MRRLRRGRSVRPALPFTPGAQRRICTERICSINIIVLFILGSVTNERPNPTPADPASHEPSQARPEPCACCASGHRAGARQPDPTDRHLAMLEELEHLGMRLARRPVASEAAPA